MSKHTPGPWRASELGVLSDKLTSYGNWYVCSLIDPDNEEHKANARLIAAAPELLAACKKALEAIRWWEGEHPCCNGSTGEQEAAIRAAIAKAEGRP